MSISISIYPFFSPFSSICSSVFDYPSIPVFPFSIFLPSSVSLSHTPILLLKTAKKKKKEIHNNAAYLEGDCSQLVRENELKKTPPNLTNKLAKLSYSYRVFEKEDKQQNVVSNPESQFIHHQT
ncbi:hypothetical protein EYC80_006073 [Monilinia laxa]|uniref:Uncharacterized protein n=1 Tax=Monilinia laxa TaxID=61186 RepID=A0A5N6KHL3_MONLA|nr:hypothetical protein EYC80_006073 [Monilinia laxa]